MAAVAFSWFVAGVLFLNLFDAIRENYFREYRIKRIAYELVPEGTFWCMLSDEDQSKIMVRARTIYRVSR